MPHCYQSIVVNAPIDKVWNTIKSFHSAHFRAVAGESRDMLWLASQGHKVLGVEISPTAVAAIPLTKMT